MGDQRNVRPILQTTPRLVVLVASRWGCEGFADLADKISTRHSAGTKGSEGDLSRRVNCYVSYAGTDVRLLLTEVGWLNSQGRTRGRVVVVVDGVMSIQGDGNTACKAKDHSRAIFNEG